MPISTAGMNAVPKPLIGRATALQNTFRNVSGSIGTAILSTLMQTHTDTAFNTYLQNLSNHVLQGISSYGMSPSVYGVTNPKQALHLLLALKQLAFQAGAQYALKISIIIIVLAFVAALAIGKKQERFGLDGAQAAKSTK
ncbi:Major facilitator superfamily transporter [Acididesulfobacillus acetoxydans]|uniref:Major facilitator superfamily domain, general substrate transporter n=1 Tax=Acididesulfobacillus acetoxydans TaxID=1561005 RepID=A0A8S0W9H2_9FIRM|nr:hypothetical protein [Acididesulfobacillus acetoxydans]CAA7602599.1 Major facilitator superfamily transporter [Acididesulfobacillus acetoxydans]CEJ07254.1 Major facilitator superfamily domain, general substrate transporter [Acididesulfobacillus acetoxydans]